MLHRTNIHTLAEEPVSSLSMNDIGVAELELTRPLFFDAYTTNRSTGSFILIDPHTNATLAAGMIRLGAAQTDAPPHKPILITFTASSTLSIAETEHRLLSEGALVVRTAVAAEHTLRGLLSLGLIVLLEGELPESTFVALAEFNPVGAQSFASTEPLSRSSSTPAFSPNLVRTDIRSHLPLKLALLQNPSAGGFRLGWRREIQDLPSSLPTGGQSPQ